MEGYRPSRLPMRFMTASYFFVPPFLVREAAMAFMPSSKRLRNLRFMDSSFRAFAGDFTFR